MKNVTTLLSALCLCATLSCPAQVVDRKSYPLLPTDSVGIRYVGTYNEIPVLCPNRGDRNALYMVERVNRDSLKLKYLRQRSIPHDSKGVRLIWVNDELEVYTLVDNRIHHYLIAREGKIDSVNITLNYEYYSYDYEPFIRTADGNFLLAAQPEWNRAENGGKYYSNVMLIDLRESPPRLQLLPITAGHMQRVGSYLYYQGGEGNFENALLRVQIPQWSKIDTLLKFTNYWFVKDSLVYARIGGYVGQDDWLEDYSGRFVAYSLKQGRCAIVSKKAPAINPPIIFEGEYYTLTSCFGPYFKGQEQRCQPSLRKIVLPTSITEFPYKQTLYPQKEKRR